MTTGMEGVKKQLERLEKGLEIKKIKDEFKEKLKSLGKYNPATFQKMWREYWEGLK